MVLTNLTKHRYLLIVMTVNLYIMNDIIKQNSSAAVPSHVISHIYVSKVDV